MSSVFPLVAKISYVVEERFTSAPDEVHFAWSFDTPKEAEVQLIAMVQAHGSERLYTSYILVD
jgi:hypothetical protein